MADLIDRQAAIDALGEEPVVWLDTEAEFAERNQWRRDVDVIKALPSVQPESKTETRIDCERAKCYGGKCLGYGKSEYDDEPIDECKKCERHASYGID